MSYGAKPRTRSSVRAVLPTRASAEMATPPAFPKIFRVYSKPLRARRSLPGHWRSERRVTMDRNLALEVVRVTEMAAISAARLMGRGTKNESDQAAVDAMRRAFDALNIDGTVVIGEGERDEAPMLYIGEKVGKRVDGSPQVDIALDPLEGTNLCAYGRPGAISVVSIASRGNLLNAPDTYMDKLAVGPKARGAIATCFEETGVDVLMGIGGAPEGVIAAAAVRCVGGDMQGRLKPRNSAEIERCKKMGITDINRIYTAEELAKGEVMFAATGVTSGDFLKGV